MKDVAEYLRWVTPFFNDTQRYKVLSWFHVLIQIVILIAFFSLEYDRARVSFNTVIVTVYSFQK